MRQNPSVALVLTAAAVAVLMVVLFVLLSPSSHPAVSSNPPKSAIPPVVLLPTNSSFSVLQPLSGPFWSQGARFPFTINESVTLDGSWNATEPTDAVVIAQNVSWTCHYMSCGQRTQTFNLTLFPGSYDLFFTLDPWVNNTTVTITQPVEILFDRVAVLLQPSGSSVIGPMRYLSWNFSIPPSSSRVDFYSDNNVSTGFYVGLMNEAQWESFKENQSAFNWSTLSWGMWSNGGETGPLFFTSGQSFGAGEYTLVFYNPNPYRSVLQFLTPLYLAYTPG
jgi:hypothetical protein